MDTFPAVVEPGALRVLTLCQPFTDAVTRLGKDVANMSRSTLYRGLVMVHAGPRPDEDAMAAIGHDHLPMPLNAVTALARLTGAHTNCDGRCSEWARPDAWHWKLTDVQPLLVPIPEPGRHGLWIPNETLRYRVAGALPTPATHLKAAVLPPK